MAEAKQKMVYLTIPSSKYETEDYYLAINGKSYQIKRDVEVEVPDYVAEAVRRHQQCEIRSRQFITATKED